MKFTKRAELRTDFSQLDDIFEPPGRNGLIVWKTDSRFFFSRLLTRRVSLARFARKTLTPRSTDFFTDFEKKKPTVLQSKHYPVYITLQLYVMYY